MILYLSNMYQALLISALVWSCTPTFGVDLSTLTSTSSFECLRQHDYDFVIVRAWRSFSSFDPNAPQTLHNAVAGGFPTDQLGVYMFPCFSAHKPASEQVNSMVEALGSSPYSKVWVDLETNSSPGCGWGTDYTANCQFVKQLVEAGKAAHKKMGIYASKYMWEKIMGGLDRCSTFTDLPLWYAHYDHKPSFEDWAPYGGWTQPTIKQYQGTTSLCGAGVDLNFMWFFISFGISFPAVQKVFLLILSLPIYHTNQQILLIFMYKTL